MSAHGKPTAAHTYAVGDRVVILPGSTYSEHTGFRDGMVLRIASVGPASGECNTVDIEGPKTPGKTWAFYLHEIRPAVDGDEIYFVDSVRCPDGESGRFDKPVTGHTTYAVMVESGRVVLSAEGRHPDLCEFEFGKDSFGDDFAWDAAAERDAIIACEALNVHASTGMSPRQLADEVASQREQNRLGAARELALADERDRLAERCAALEKDAARYRFLVEPDNAIEVGVSGCFTDLSDRIDAALSTTGKAKP